MAAMRQRQERIEVATRGRGFVDVTERVAAVVRASGVTTGIAVVFCRHTSAGVLVQENYDPAVQRDLDRWLERAAPEGADYEHDDEGADDMPSHIRTMLTRTSESIPVAEGALVLGRWQAIYVAEHRRRAHTRELVVHVVGE
jgi:secondary thiamine-phosphate synthase enzyme